MDDRMNSLNEPIDSLVVGKGENCAHVHLFRDSRGLRVSVKAHVALEEFMKNLGDGRSQPVDAYSKLWQSVTTPTGTLDVYNARDYGVQSETYRLDRPGQALSLDHQIVNLSFLRIVGVSQGVTFRIRGPFSRPEVDNLQDELTEAIEELYKTYIKPVDAHILVTTYNGSPF